MKGYRIFLLIFALLFTVYIVAEINRPPAIDWTVTLSKEDKNPYGSYVLFEQLPQLFPNTTVQSLRKPVYDQINNSTDSTTAYIIVAPAFEPTTTDIEEMIAYVGKGNDIFIAASQLGKAFMDTLGVDINPGYSFLSADSTSINLSNPSLKAAQNYRFRKNTIDEFFSTVDTTYATVLGVNQNGKPNFIMLGFGKGHFYVHAAPICFSNYFMLFQNNQEYLSKAFSYIPQHVTALYWDEYYKLGPTGPGTPLRFFLTKAHLKWAFWLSLIGMIVFVLFEMKRKQRIIPIIEPLRNTTLDFVKTVSGVYFNQRDNGSIAAKKVQYWLEFIRQRFYISTTALDDDFVQAVSRKSGVSQKEITTIIAYIQQLQQTKQVNDRMLIALNNSIDSFYQQAK